MIFRTLYADEIECRIGRITENYLTLLLYKDARCDMQVLDEAVGSLNWQRQHSRENANCIVSIWDEKKKQWVSKEDTGTESNAEKEKGLASDSFKRACTNWGIGRELYTAPAIWVDASKCDIKLTGRTDRNNKQIFACYDKFKVTEISYSNNRKIASLSIINDRTKGIVFTYRNNEILKGNKSVESDYKKAPTNKCSGNPQAKSGQQNSNSKKLTRDEVEELKKAISYRGTVEQFLEYCKINDLSETPRRKFDYVIRNWIP